MPDVNNTKITVDRVIQEYGEHYIDNGQNMQHLHMLPFEKYGTTEVGTIEETDQTVIRHANIRVGEVLQPFQAEFTNKGSLVALPVWIALHHVKIDTSFIPHELKGSWMDFLALNQIDPLQMPFTAWVAEVYLIKQAKADMEMKAIYKGVRKDPEEGVPGLAVDAQDGIEKHILDLEKRGDIEFIITGSWPTSPSELVTKVEDFVKSIPELYRYDMELVINASRTFRDKFKQGMRDKYNVNYQQTEQLLRLMDFENVTVAGRGSMMGKNRIWATPKSNFRTYTKGFSNANVFDVQKEDRKVKFLTDWWTGCGFIQPELIFTNELN